MKNSMIKEYQEIDVPLEKEEPNESKMSMRDVEMLERAANAADKFSKAQAREHAYTLVIVCIAILTALIVCDTVLAFCSHQISDYAANFFELLKYIVTLCIGYLFATRNKAE